MYIYADICFRKTIVIGNILINVLSYTAHYKCAYILAIFMAKLKIARIASKRASKLVYMRTH